MNPLNWQGPRIFIYLGLYVIVCCRSTLMYTIARAVTTGLSKTRMMQNKMSGQKFSRASALIARYGAPAVALCFFTVGLQTLILLASGTSKMPLRSFLPAVALGGMFWAGIYGTVGLVGFKLIAKAWAYNPFFTVGVLMIISSAVMAYIYIAKTRTNSLAVL